MASVKIECGREHIPASKLAPGQLGIIVASPHKGYIGRVVIGLSGGCDDVYASLDSGSIWTGSGNSNLVRVLDKGEKVILANP
jgi:hypothetical protein